MKRLALIFIVSLFASLFLCYACLAADNSVSITVRGAAARIGSAKPFIKSDRTMVPLSFVRDNLNIRAAWNEYTGTITMINGKTVTAVVGDATMTVDGKASAQPAAPVLSGSVAYVPLRAVCDIYGISLNWDAAARTAEVGDVPALPTAAGKTIILATTTSTKDSGLLDYLLPYFTGDTGIGVTVVPVGTGAALKMGADGEADVMLVHAKSNEIQSMKNGDAISRRELMYNDFILVGPVNDPADVKSARGGILAALKDIYASGSLFISRGDNSGTDILEKSLWKQDGITPDPKNYYEAATGMLAVLTIADEKSAYTLTDRSTWLANQDKFDLRALCENDPRLFNQYSVMVVNPDKNDRVNALGGMEFAEWMTSRRGLDLISRYGADKYGKPLFYIDYKPEQ